MPVSRAKRASNNKWDKENMKLVACKIRADKAEQFKEYAANMQTTPNALLRGYIYKCIGESPDETPNAETIQRDNEAALSAPVQPEEVEPDSTVAFHSEQVYDLTPHQRAAPVDVLGLSVRTYNMIRRAGCETVGELVEYLHTDKCVIPHEGKAYREIEDALDEFAGK